MTFLFTPRLAIASSSRIQGSSPTPVVHLKHFPHVVRVLCLRLVCESKNENENPGKESFKYGEYF